MRTREARPFSFVNLARTMNEQSVPPGPSRTAFLAAGVAGAALLAAASPALAADEAASLETIESVLHRPARHKQVIAAPKINAGAALRYAGNSLNAFDIAFKQPGSLHVACVFYGSSIFYCANDALWGKYSLFDVLDAVADPLPLLVHTPANPFLHPRPGSERDFSVETLMKRGVTFFVCNNALHELSSQIARIQKLAPDAVYEDFHRNLAPGSIVVPAGVAALVLAQEAGFTFLAG